MDEVLGEIRKKIKRTNVSPCPIREKTLIAHNTESVRCTDTSCWLFDKGDENCSLKSRIYKPVKKELSYSFDALLGFD